MEDPRQEIKGLLQEGDLRGLCGFGGCSRRLHGGTSQDGTPQTRVPGRIGDRWRLGYAIIDPEPYHGIFAVPPRSALPAAPVCSAAPQA